MTTCTVCQARTETNLCNRCVRQLEQALAETPSLLCELDVTITRQDRGTGAALYAMGRRRLQLPGLHYDEGTTTLVATPWTFSWDAADLRWRVESTVHTWARHIAETRDVPVSANPGAFLLANLDAIRLDEAAADIHEEITACRHDLTRAIDRQEPDLFAGRCDARIITLANLEAALLTPELAVCGADLYARTGDADVKCPDCGTVYDLIARSRQMAEAADDQWARPHLIADALTTLEHRVNAATLRSWIERDARLVEELAAGRKHRKTDARPLVLQVGVDDDGRALFRVGDVRARIAWAIAAGRIAISA